MELLRERNILLELCITSNVHTGVIPAVEDHPIGKLRDAGIPVSINTDDPAISAITLSGEYVEAVTRLGFTETELKKMNEKKQKQAVTNELNVKVMIGRVTSNSLMKSCTGIKEGKKGKMSRCNEINW